MSVAREVKQTFDLDQLASAAEKQGYTVERNAVAYGYYSGAMHNGKKFPLVIKGKGHSGRFDMAFTEDKMVHDAHGGYTEQALAKILPEYYRDAIEANGYTIDSVENTHQEIIITVNA